MAITMTEQDDDFLKRWSRRKQAAAADAQRVRAPSPTDTASAAPQPKTDDIVDPATLPPLDSITALTDIRDFLRSGVPAELTRAALRRAWSADPAIRDFIGLSENSWDFTAPDGIPGFGPLNAGPEEVKALVDQMISRTSDLAAAAPDATLKSEPEQGVQPQVKDGDETAATPLEPTPDHHPAQLAADAQPANVALQQEDVERSPRPRRSHGGALPR
jgi:hypothetical protein